MVNKAEFIIPPLGWNKPFLLDIWLYNSITTINSSDADVEKK